MKIGTDEHFRSRIVGTAVLSPEIENYISSTGPYTKFHTQVAMEKTNGIFTSGKTHGQVPLH